MHLLELCRYDWVYELIDADPAVRASALARHNALLDEWQGYGESSGTLLDLVTSFSGWWRASRQPDLAPYALLFLQWELRFPEEWRDSWCNSPWSAKEGVLKAFCGDGPTPQTAAPLEDLVIGTVRRVQRCQDRWYWRLARVIDSPSLRARLVEAGHDDEERTRLRARYLLWLMDHPAANINSAGWRRWLRSEGRPLAHPVAALDLAAMKPAAAAAELVDLAPPDLARVLESLHAGPAARIITAIRTVGPAVRAIELMDGRMAARALKAMEPHHAAAVLSAMTPAAAAARYPGPSREILMCLDTFTAVAQLRAMPPSTAIRRLSYLPREKAMALVRHLDREIADAVLNYFRR